MKKAKSTAIRKSEEQIKSILAIRTILAGCMVVILLLQLFTFEDFWSLIADLGFDDLNAKLLSVAVVLLELLALPFWLRMKIPRTLGAVSVVSGVLAILLLSALEIMGFMFGKVVMFGATLTFPAGAWTMVLIFALGVLELWAILEPNMAKFDKKSTI